MVHESLISEAKWNIVMKKGENCCERVNLQFIKQDDNGLIKMFALTRYISFYLDIKQFEIYFILEM